MTMIKSEKSLLRLSVAAMLAGLLVLAGCGGSGPQPAGPDLELEARQEAQRMAIGTAVDAASDAVNAVGNTSTDTIVTEADDAIAAAKAAVTAGTDLPAGDSAVIAANATIAALETQLASAKTARQMAMDAADQAAQDAADRAAEEARKAAAALGKAMHAALAGPAAPDTTVLNNATFAFTAGALTVTPAAGAGSFDDGVTPPAADLRAGAAATALSGWKGTNYAHTDTDTNVVNEARVYNNQAAAGTQPFSGTGGKYTLISGQTGDAALNNGYVRLG